MSQVGDNDSPFDPPGVSELLSTDGSLPLKDEWDSWPQFCLWLAFLTGSILSSLYLAAASMFFLIVGRAFWSQHLLGMASLTLLLLAAASAARLTHGIFHRRVRVSVISFVVCISASTVHVYLILLP